ncbi:alpha/beta hydrolase fold domain-containing protein [Frankia sp. AgB1.9]|uniref:alpha/beta hydrolase fold domain-containing protein n=1 Tax=unclassified Frankia TaxID=2632575 RepID=UPI001931824C|nr:MULTISPECIES: alpha/beta hydrolase fold domain-containing protein [unclassified Frankia]MBL7487546.1 alpha/beta hydrolase fold domain-containing protein [Frankia sp. AgW1.1]MBL7549517.1 alpha/beta hydrolase fold domain-containing protein [Frankia sp. AgB1.9]MBL7620694.1 alpha/beta hydrolase fold domain-containing protein [Frankia sp. AgB1.8]
MTESFAHDRTTAVGREVAIREVAVSVGDASIRTRLYTPAGAPSTAALLWMHGGGFSGGSIDMPEGDAVSRAFARAGVAVLSVDYRRVPPLSRVRRWRGAPAVRFPVPVLDCLAAWRRLVEEAEPLGLKAGQIFAGGASAGANLAVMSTLRAASAGAPVPAGLLLAYPLLHPVLPARPTERARGLRARFLGRVAQRSVRMMAANFVGAANTSRVAGAFPAREDLDGFPPTLIVTGEHDSLRASGEAFADDLRPRGVEADCQMEVGVRHGHLNHPDSVPFAHTMSVFTTWLSVHAGV